MAKLPLWPCGLAKREESRLHCVWASKQPVIPASTSTAGLWRHVAGQLATPLYGNIDRTIGRNQETNTGDLICEALKWAAQTLVSGGAACCCCCRCPSRSAAALLAAACTPYLASRSWCAFRVLSLCCCPKLPTSGTPGCSATQ